MSGRVQVVTCMGLSMINIYLWLETRAELRLLSKARRHWNRPKQPKSCSDASGPDSGVISTPV